MPRDPKELLYQLYEDRSRSEGGHYYLLKCHELKENKNDNIWNMPTPDS